MKKQKEKMNETFIRTLKPKELIIYGLLDKVAVFNDVKIYEEKDIIVLIFPTIKEVLNENIKE